MTLLRRMSLSKPNHFNIKKYFCWNLLDLEIKLYNFSLTFFFSLCSYSEYKVLCLGNLVSLCLSNHCPIYTFLAKIIYLICGHFSVFKAQKKTGQVKWLLSWSFHSMSYNKQMSNCIVCQVDRGYREKGGEDTWQGMVFNLAGSEKVMFELRPNGVRGPVMQRLWAGGPREEERQVQRSPVHVLSALHQPAGQPDWKGMNMGRRRRCHRGARG